MSRQLDGSTIPSALLIETQALVAVIGEDIIFVTTCVELLLGGSADEQVARHALFRSRNVGLINDRTVCRALQNKSRLLRDNLARTECFHHGLVGSHNTSARCYARDDIRRTAHGNEEVLVLQVIRSITSGAEFYFLTKLIAVARPIGSCFVGHTAIRGDEDFECSLRIECIYTKNKGCGMWNRYPI